MDEDNALALARALARRGVRCRLTRTSPRDYALQVPLPDGKQVVWNRHRDTLEARVVSSSGNMIGFVTLRVGSDETADQVAGRLAQQRYERLSSTGRAGRLADPGRRAGSHVVTRLPAVDRQRAPRPGLILLAVVLLLTLQLLYVLASRA